ncbi:hypothetical protein [Pedobacter rhodius]|uniref:Uncharacterized protein n=1 Tax=Pedobacter rhodius TaxID=3004098 RepID=A0ABT4L0X9_9SPHI|nr:hypothetical protein [Pedobacter sp. SJ11]MCZ4224838.1 hypothetical protein [Pedobacter sp. SJ11]
MNKIQTELSVFLRKVKGLRGYGDMDSYKYVKKLEDLGHKNEYELNKIIQGFSTPETYNGAKSALIQQIEKEIADNYANDSDCI